MSSTHRHLFLDFFWQVISGPACIHLRQAYVHCEQGIKFKLLDTGTLIRTEKLKKQMYSITQMKL
jgi:hypothetical protein